MGKPINSDKWSETAEGVARESVSSCPRTGCGRSASPVRRAGCGNGVTVEPLRHRQTKEAENRYVLPKATAPHLDSTGLNASTRSLTHGPIGECRFLCWFLDAGNKKASRAQLTGVQKAPRHEVAGNLAPAK